MRPAARRDILAQVAHYLDELAYEAAERFPLALREAVLQIEQQPGIGSPRKFKNPSLAGLRSWPVPGFEESRIVRSAWPAGSGQAVRPSGEVGRLRNKTKASTRITEIRRPGALAARRRTTLRP